MDAAQLVNGERMECQYGRRCYRRNPGHFVEYSHRDLEEVGHRINTGELDDIITEGYDSGFLEQAQCVAELLSNGEIARNVRTDPQPQEAVGPSNVAPEPPRKKQKVETSEAPKLQFRTVFEKIEASSPFRYFLSTVHGAEETERDPLSLTYSDIFDPSLGSLDESLQVNFMVEVGWLLAQYVRFGLQRKKLLIVHGEDTEELRTVPSRVPTLTTVRVKPKYPFGHHHTKMTVLYYDDKSLRVVVHTGNLIESDWEHRTQGLWISPKCPEVSEGSDGESPTGFKRDLLRYFQEYPVSQLRPWIERLRNADMSQINVCFIPSIPGSYPGKDPLWGHGYLSQLLKKHVEVDSSDSSSSWQTIIQCSSIGSLGNGPQDWLQGELGQAMASSQGKLQSAVVKVVFPSYRNVAQSIDGLLGGGCLPYTMKSHQKQQWFTTWLHQWKSDARHRSRAMPHIKTYTRISSDSSKCAWFVLSSANLSKAAWGMRTKNGALMIQSYEAGVLFLPKFLNSRKLFQVGSELKLPFDVPLTKYAEDDEPWFIDHLRAIR